MNYKLAIISVILAAIFGGGIGVVGKIGLREIPPFTFTFLRFFLATIFTLPFLLKNKIKPKSNKDIIKIALVSILATANVTLFAFGIRLTSATSAQLLYVLTPVAVAIFSYFILKERLGIKKFFGIILGLIGVIVVIGIKINGGFIGSLIILIGMLCYSLYSVLIKKLQVNFSPVFLNFIFTLTTTLILSSLAIFDLTNSPGWWVNLSLGAVLSTLYIGIFGGTAYYLALQYAIKNSSPTIASMTLFLQPVATYVWAAGLLNETLTIQVGIGAVIILLGAVMVVKKN